MILTFLTLAGVRIEMRSRGEDQVLRWGSGNQELGLDIIFKYFVSSLSGGQVSSSVCKAGVQS